jgi:thymidylate synthase ThyX
MTANYERQIYLLSPKQLSPETIAVTFAKTSRSPNTFQEIADELTDEKSADFHEKWVVGYGHASVAEHAVLHIAFENVSRLAIDTIEGNRLASYTEKSTRYQKWEPDSFHIPAELEGTDELEIYRRACERLFEAYLASLRPVQKVIQAAFPRREDESEARWDARLRSKYIDVCRYYLPAAALANVGMTANARVMEHAIRKMLSSPLEEVRAIGEEVKRAAQLETPTLVKYADRVPYLVETRDQLRKATRDSESSSSQDWMSLLHYDPLGEVHVLAAAIFEQSELPYQASLKLVEGMSQNQREDAANSLFAARGRFDAPLRAIENTTYMVETTLDQGAYFELKRHRIMTQLPQQLTTRLGYCMPKLIVEAGLEDNFREMMEKTADDFETLAAWNPDVASYVVPNAFNRRVLMNFNLREAFHFCELRSQPNAHFAIRRLAFRLAEEIQRVHPILGGYLRVEDETGWREIETGHITQA